MTRLPKQWERLGLRHAGRHAIVSSVRVAQAFDRRHGHVLRDIDELQSHHPNLDSERWFAPAVYRSSRGRDEPAYDMTRAGFVLLVMGWTGPKALDFKIAYIEAFDRMEEALLTGQLNPVSAARGRQIARELLTRAHEARPAGAIRLRERDIRRTVAPRLIAEHAETLLAAIGEWLHNEVYHPWLRQEKKSDRDPDHPDLFSYYSVPLDGENDVPVPLERLTKGNKLWIIGRGFKNRAGWLRAIEKLWRHDAALIDHHNRTRPDDPITSDEIAAAAPDLIEQ